MKDLLWTIKRKLLALGAATLLPLLLFLAFWVWWETCARTAHAEAELMLASRQVASQFEGLLENVKEQLRALAQNPVTRVPMAVVAVPLGEGKGSQAPASWPLP